MEVRVKTLQKSSGLIEMLFMCILSPQPLSNSESCEAFFNIITYRLNLHPSTISRAVPQSFLKKVAPEYGVGRQLGVKIRP